MVSGMIARTPARTTRPPAMYHAFGDLLKCICGRTWHEHQHDPRPCPLAEEQLRWKREHSRRREVREP